MRVSDAVRFSNIPPPSEPLKRFALMNHIPGVSAEGVDMLQTSIGVAAVHRFEEWLDLEGPGAHEWKSYFTGSTQTFFGLAIEKEVDAGSLDVGRLQSAARFGASYFWLLLILSYSTLIPHPALSLAYLVFRRVDGQRRVGRFRGLAELEALRLPVRIRIEPEDKAVLLRNDALLRRLSETGRLAYVERLTDPFWSTLNKEPLASDWLQFVCQLELLLNPEGTTPLGSELAHRLAYVCAAEPAEVDSYFEMGRRLYAFRSSSLHDQEAIAKDSLAEYLGRANYPFPFTIVRRCCEFLALDHEDPLGALPHRTQRYQPVPAENRLATLQPSPTQAVEGEEDGGGLAIARSTDMELSFPAQKGADLEEIRKFLMERGNVVGEVQSERFTRTVYYLTEPKAEVMQHLEAAGHHFAEVVGDHAVLFVPLIGLQHLPEPFWVTEHEALMTLPHATWHSLENRRYRDLFESIVVRFPRVHLAARLGPASEDSRAWYQLKDVGSDLYRSVSHLLDAYATAFSIVTGGMVVSPHKVPWTVVDRFMRTRLREDQFRFYSFVMADELEPIFEKVEINGQGDFQEVPVMPLPGHSTRTDGELLQTVGSVRDRIVASGIWKDLPDFHQICRLVSGYHDPTNTMVNRLIQTVIAFERAFGPLSAGRIGKTHHRLRQVFESSGVPVDLDDQDLLADSIRRLRNDIAHGRVPDASAGDELSVVTLGLRLFVSRFLSWYASSGQELAVGGDFRLAKKRFYREP